MNNDSILKLYIILMEKGTWNISSKKLEKFHNNKELFSDLQEIELDNFFEICKSNSEKMMSLLESLQTHFKFFNFVKSKDFTNLTYESLLLFKENNEFLKDMYEVTKSSLKNPNKIGFNKNLFKNFVDGFFEFSSDLSLVPNLCSLKEFLILALYIKEMNYDSDKKTELDNTIKKEINNNAENNLENNEVLPKEEILNFEEFKILIIIFVKFMHFKFSKIYDYHEESYIQQFLWYLFLNLVNNDKMKIEDDLKIYNSNRKENIFFNLNRSNLKPKALFKKVIQNQIEQIFLIFGNNFSKFGHPLFLLDLKKLNSFPYFKNHMNWIESYLKNKQPDFNSFIYILKAVVDLKHEDINYENSLKNFITENKINSKICLKTNYIELPEITTDNWNQMNRLFEKYAINKQSIYVMDFFFMCKNYQIVPKIYNNKEVMILFYQTNIRRLISIDNIDLDTILNPDNFLYLDFQSFQKIIYEFAFTLVQDSLQIHPNQQLRVFFNKFIRD